MGQSAVLLGSRGLRVVRGVVRRYLEQEQKCSHDYIAITKIYNQKVAAAGDDKLAEPALPLLSKFVMF